MNQIVCFFILSSFAPYAIISHRSWYPFDLQFTFVDKTPQSIFETGITNVLITMSECFANYPCSLNKVLI